MRPAPLQRIDPDELVVDAFCGGGGAAEAILQALGRGPDVAINHHGPALAMHAANHPLTDHRHGDMWLVRPDDLVRGHDFAFLWGSPDCTYFSKARGAKPFRDPRAARKRRALPGTLLRIAKRRPRVIIVENVEEFEEWGPVLANGLPDPDRAGQCFRVWVGKLRALGYTVEWRQLRACDYGAATTRKRLFIVARCDGQPIVWPEPTHGPGRAHPYRTAAECIDWSIRCPSIFERRRPLAPKTLARICRGFRRFVFESGQPFLIPLTHAGDLRAHCIDDPMRTITGANRGEYALIAPVLYHSGNGERVGQSPRIYDLHAPLGTVMAQGVKHALGVAFLARHFGGNGTAGSGCDEPLRTITTQDHHALVTAELVRMGAAARGHGADVRALLERFEGIVDPVVRVGGETYEIVDIGQRMLTPRELFTCQGFPPTYVIDPVVNGKRLSKTEQVRMCGNSVSPPPAQALIEANFPRTVPASKQMTLRVA